MRHGVSMSGRVPDHRFVPAGVTLACSCSWHSERDDGVLAFRRRRKWAGCAGDDLALLAGLAQLSPSLGGIPVVATVQRDLGLAT